MKDCHIFTKPVFRDNRGYFIEQLNSDKNELGVQIHQISESQSLPYTFRGFHFQIKNKMAKIMRVLDGKTNIYLLNLLNKTPVLKVFELHSVEYTYDVAHYLYVPPHYAVGFIALENTRMQYFHNTVRSDHTRSINISSVVEQGTLTESIEIMSDSDKHAMSWDEWKSLEEEKWLC